MATWCGSDIHTGKGQLKTANGTIHTNNENLSWLSMIDTQLSLLGLLRLVSFHTPIKRKKRIPIFYVNHLFVKLIRLVRCTSSITSRRIRVPCTFKEQQLIIDVLCLELCKYLAKPICRRFSPSLCLGRRNIPLFECNCTPGLPTPRPCCWVS